VTSKPKTCGCVMPKDKTTKKPTLKAQLESDIAARERAELDLRRFKFISDHSNDGHDLIDREGRLLYVNHRACERLGYTEEELLKMKLSDIDPMCPKPRIQELFDMLAKGRVPPFESIRRRKDGTVFPVEVSMTGVNFDGKDYIFVAARNISDRKRVEEALRMAHEELESRVEQRTLALHQALDVLQEEMVKRRELSAKITRLQDDERRRLARELHDTTVQNLVALKFGLAQAQERVGTLDPKLQEILAESAELAEQSIREIRTLSYTLHPPMLDERGLASALRLFAEGFSQRSGVSVDLAFPEDIGRLPQEVELAGFRIVQECLSNVHRHSKSQTARVAVELNDDHFTLEVSDGGVGLPESESEHWHEAEERGIGIRGMRERARQLGGSIEIDSSPSGTRVRAIIPVEPQGS
jgi:PAS domain S-box-containing protein